MKLNVERKVKHYRLAKNKAYFALFEAISNSIDSQRNIGNSSPIEVIFSREPKVVDLFDSPQENRLYREICIKDHGEGFTDKNFESFETSDSDLKEDTGGKGLGRFSWLKVFERVSVESYFNNNGITTKRSFNFEKVPKGIVNHSCIDVEKRDSGTILCLHSQRKEWEIPRKLQTFCEKLIEHFLPLFVNKTIPPIILSDADSDDLINVAKYFSDNYKGEIKSKTFSIKDVPFNISIHKTKIGSSNQLAILANNRATKTVNLAKHIIDLNAQLNDESGQFYIVAFLSSEYLDAGVTPERDDFMFEVAESTDDISLGEIVATAAENIEEEINDLLIGIFEKKVKEINNFIASEAPEYRYIVARNPGILHEISPTADKQEIENRLHCAEIQYKEETRSEVQAILSKDEIDIGAVDAAYDRVSEAATADLTKYILWRSQVISLLEKRIAWDDERKFEKENELHRLFYQMRKTSDEVPYETNNLWLIDERLNFCDYLASDIPMDAKSGLRPDILTYNAPYYFNNEDNPCDSFSIIEFKRPNRSDYTEEENPIDQVFEYIEKIRENRARKSNGQLITVSPNTPCFVYIVADLTDKLRKMCARQDYIRDYDNQGYFSFNSKYNVYIEVLSYQKIAREARNRNRIFMKKIGIK